MGDCTEGGLEVSDIITDRLGETGTGNVIVSMRRSLVSSSSLSCIR